MIAAQSLGKYYLPNEEIVGILVKALEDPDPLVREKSAESLGKTRSIARVALPKLRELAENDSSTSVREAAIEAVGKILFT